MRLRRSADKYTRLIVRYFEHHELQIVPDLAGIVVLRKLVRPCGVTRKSTNHIGIFAHIDRCPRAVRPRQASFRWFIQRTLFRVRVLKDSTRTFHLIIPNVRSRLANKRPPPTGELHHATMKPRPGGARLPEPASGNQEERQPVPLRRELFRTTPKKPSALQRVEFGSGFIFR